MGRFKIIIYEERRFLVQVEKITLRRKLMIFDCTRRNHFVCRNYKSLLRKFISCKSKKFTSFRIFITYRKGLQLYSFVNLGQVIKSDLKKIIRKKTDIYEQI